MSGLGSEAYVQRLVVSESIKVPRVKGDLIATGSVHGIHKTIGEAMNKHHLKQKGSVFYLQYDEFHQISAISTTNSQSSVVVTTTAAIANLASSDVITIIDFNLEEVNNIPRSEIVKDHTLASNPTSSGSDSVITLTTTSAADATQSITSNVSGLLRVRRFKYIDMASSTTTWVYSTSLPDNVTPGHTNTEVFYE